MGDCCTRGVQIVAVPSDTKVKKRYGRVEYWSTTLVKAARNIPVHFSDTVNNYFANYINEILEKEDSDSFILFFIKDRVSGNMKTMAFRKYQFDESKYLDIIKAIVKPNSEIRISVQISNK